MTVADWGWVNWYATRRHLPDHARVIRGRTWALCGKTDLTTLVEHAKRRREYGRKPLDYGSIPKCKFCQRKASE